LLGWASLFTDAATEMIYPLLPVYLSRVLGAGALSLGVIEGVAEGVNSLLKILSGWMSDRRARRKPIVIGGYALSSLSRPFIAMANSWQQVLVIRVVDRTGKGIRGAPRDAMLAQFAASDTRGRIFGFHRAMDHTGAIVGPLLATAILFLAPENYRLVFALTIVPGLIAVWLLFLVPEKTMAAEATRASVAVPAEAESHKQSGAHEPPRADPRRGAFSQSRPFWVFMAVLFLFTLGNSADAFLLLRLSDVLGSATYVPLLWSGLHMVKASLSTWGGGLSDRLGRRTVIVMGWGVYAIVYLGFAISDSTAAFIGWFLLYGVFFALTEGAEKALIADLTSVSRQGTAFGIYNAVLGVGALTASVAFGVLYQRVGPATAFGVGAALAGLAAVLLLSTRLRPGDFGGQPSIRVVQS
jgi:MFS family permease